MARQIFAAEISHEDAPLQIREKLVSSEATIKEHLEALSPLVEEVCIVSSSSRFALYVVHDDITPVTEFFGQYPALKGYIQYYYNTEESITHLLATASGLLSDVKGEHKILTDIKTAHRWAVEAGTIGITLDNLLRESIRIGKKVRTQTGIDKFGCSIVEAGIELLYNRLDELHNKTFLVIGTGRVSRMMLEYLYNEGIQNVYVAGRDMSRTREIANEFYVEAVSLDNVTEYFAKSDIIIGGTNVEVPFFSNASDGTFSWDFFTRDRVRFVLDFGMPRNFNSKIGEHPSVELYNLDDLKRTYKSALDAFGGMEEAWSMVMKEARNFMHVLWQLEVSPVLVAYWNRLLDVKQRDMKLLPQRAGEKISEQEVQLLKKYAHRISRSITGVAKKNLQAMVNNSRAENGSELVRTFVPIAEMRFNFSVN